MQYRTVYGYPWPRAIEAELWWRIENLFWRRYRGGDGGLFGYVNLFGYGRRKAAERRGAAAMRKP
jgi:hypothetical protein